MNVNDVKQLKQHYENLLIERTAEIFKIDKKQVNANWDLQQTDVMISLSANNKISRYIFTYSDSNFIITAGSHQIITEQNIPVGVIAATSTIDLTSIEAIRDIIVETINKPINEDKSECDSTEGEKDTDVDTRRVD